MIAKKCSGCGGNLCYNPQTEDLYCESCSKHDTFEVKKYEDEKESLDLSKKYELNQQNTINCPNCGAVNQANEKSVSYICKHCGTPIALDTFNGNVDAVLPFLITPENAKEIYKNWIKKKIFAPRDLRKLANLGKIEGHYIPSWAFDAFAETDYRGVAEKQRTITKHGPNGQTYTETITERYNFSGRRSDDFHNVIVTGNNYIPNSLLEKLEPFDYSKLKVFSNEFLLGYFVDAYSIDLPQGFKNAQGEMEATIRMKINGSVSGRVVSLSTNINYSRLKMARYLVPIYYSIFRYKQKDYNFYINGSNGRIKGEYPLSKPKVWSAIITGLVVLGVIVYFIVKNA